MLVLSTVLTVNISLISIKITVFKIIINDILTYLLIFDILVSIIMTTQNTKLTSVLESLGLSKNSAIVYLACLELGPSSIWQISKKSGIKRPTCYVILEELAWKGFASSSNNGKRVEYSVISPKRLAQVEDRRHNSFLDSVSELKAIASKSKEKPSITTYEGIEGIKHAYNLMLEMTKNSEALVIGANIATENNVFADFLTNYHIPNRIKKAINIRAIFPDTPNAREFKFRDKLENRKTKLIELKKYNPQTQTCIFDDTVVYFVRGESEPFATVIESAALAEDERQKFELIWRMTEN